MAESGDWAEGGWLRLGRGLAAASDVHIDVEQPPNKEQRYEREQYMADPLAGGLRFAQIEHLAMLAL